jgi:uncharacterized membrane protein YfcA
MVIAAALMAGGCFGSTLVLKLSPDLIRKLFKVLLVIIVVKMFFTEKTPSSSFLIPYGSITGSAF